MSFTAQAADLATATLFIESRHTCMHACKPTIVGLHRCSLKYHVSGWKFYLLLVCDVHSQPVREELPLCCGFYGHWIFLCLIDSVYTSKYLLHQLFLEVFKLNIFIVDPHSTVLYPSLQVNTAPNCCLIFLQNLKHLICLSLVIIMLINLASEAKRKYLSLRQSANTIFLGTNWSSTGI